MRYLALVVLMGCATPQQQAARESTALLCFVRATGNPMQVSLASEALQARGGECTPYLIAAGERELYERRARQQADSAAATALGAALLTQPPPQVTPPQAPLNCYSTRSGVGVVTTCQ